MTLAEARMQCAVSGHAKLVTIRSDEEEEFVNSQFLSTCLLYLAPLSVGPHPELEICLEHGHK